MRVSVGPAVKTLLAVVGVLLLVLLACQTGLSLIGQAVWRSIAPDEVTDVAEYPAIRSANGADSLIAHFPTSVPPAAFDVTFSAYPGFLQGGGWTRLDFRMPAGEAKAPADEVAKLSEFQVPHGTRLEDVITEPMYVALLDRFHSDRPAGSIMYVTDVPAKQDDSGWWNHGYAAGAYYMPASDRLIYWAEWW